MNAQSRPSGQKKENVLVNIGLNVIIPSLIMMQSSSEDRLGPLYSILVALLFPLGYGAWDIVRRKKINFLSIVGMVAVILTGVVGLLRLSADWLAFKEGAVPLVIALVIIISQRTRFPLLRSFLNELMDLDMIDQAFADSGNTSLFEKQMMRAAYVVGSMFLFSALVNYMLVKMIVVSPAGTPEFTAELGRMTLVSYPVIVVPSFVILIVVFSFLIKSIKKHTSLDTDHIFKL